MSFYPFDNQITSATTLMPYVVYSSNSYILGAWDSSFAPTYIRTLNLFSADLNHSIIEVITDGASPVRTNLLCATNSPYTTVLTLATRQITTSPYLSVTAYVSSNDPPPGMSTLFPTLSQPYSSLYVYAEEGLSPRILTYPQPTDSLIIFPPIASSYSQVDNFTNQAAYDIVHSVSGSVPIVGGLEIDLSNLFPYYNPTSHSYNFNGSTLDQITQTSVSTSNGGVFTMDSVDNLIYQWITSDSVTLPPSSFIPPKKKKLLKTKKRRRDILRPHLTLIDKFLL